MFFFCINPAPCFDDLPGVLTLGSAWVCGGAYGMG
uniref:Uncharacterized protein n=1 Tax=Arundo donax TaxID=35708 RepID=A0A0A8YSS1_ARUDO